jgi:hypothetical protein
MLKGYRLKVKSLKQPHSFTNKFKWVLGFLLFTMIPMWGVNGLGFRVYTLATPNVPKCTFRWKGAQKPTSLESATKVHKLGVGKLVKSSVKKCITYYTRKGQAPAHYVVEGASQA